MNESHPSNILKQKTIDILRDTASKAEKDGKLTKAQLNLIYEQHWFQLFMSGVRGEKQLPLSDVMQLFEALSWADGSVGWVVSRCACFGRMSGFVDKSDKLFNDEKVCISGSDAMTCTAHETKGGYRLDGFWQYASGAPDATAFVINCIKTADGQPIKDEKDVLNVITFVLSKNEVNILPTWNAMGLVATASNDFEVKSLQLPADRAINAAPEFAKADAPIYRYPYQQLTEAAMAVCISGMAIHFIDLCQSLFNEQKSKGGATLMSDSAIQTIFDKFTTKFYDARTKLLYAVDLTWQAATNNLQIKPAILYKVSSGAYEVARRARECVDALYPYCGLPAADKSSEINRVWRDLHTATQHSLLAFGSLPE